VPTINRMMRFPQDRGGINYKELESLAGQASSRRPGLTNGRHEVGLGYGICDDLNDHSASDVDAGIEKHWPNLTQLQVNAVIGFAVAAFGEQNSGKLN
jgi:hypothetical protein